MSLHPHPAGPGLAPPSARDIDATELLRPVVEVARAVFGARASSVCLLDVPAQELVFEAVSGEGEEFLVGCRFPARRGIAGYVTMSGETMLVEDLSDDPLFARDIAEATHFVPRSLMAAPLLDGERSLGVLEVLDPVPQPRGHLGDLDLLALLARQASVSLRLTGRGRGAETSRVPTGPPRGEPAVVQPVVAPAATLSDDTRAACLALTELVRTLLQSPPPPGGRPVGGPGGSGRPPD